MLAPGHFLFSKFVLFTIFFEIMHLRLGTLYFQTFAETSEHYFHGLIFNFKTLREKYKNIVH